MRITEVADSKTIDSQRLLGLVDFLDGRAEDTNSGKQIGKKTFLQMANNLGIALSDQDLQAVIDSDPLNSVLEPFDPNSDVITFKGAEIGGTQMPVNKAQDIVAKAAKSAMKRNRSV